MCSLGMGSDVGHLGDLSPGGRGVGSERAVRIPSDYPIRGRCLYVLVEGVARWRIAECRCCGVLEG